MALLRLQFFFFLLIGNIFLLKRREKKICFLFLRQILTHMVFSSENTWRYLQQKIVFNFYFSSAACLMMNHVSCIPLLKKDCSCLLFPILWRIECIGYLLRAAILYPTRKSDPFLEMQNKLTCFLFFKNNAQEMQNKLTCFLFFKNNAQDSWNRQFSYYAACQLQAGNPDKPGEIPMNPIFALD